MAAMGFEPMTLGFLRHGLITRGVFQKYRSCMDHHTFNVLLFHYVWYWMIFVIQNLLINGLSPTIKHSCHIYCPIQMDHIDIIIYISDWIFLSMCRAQSNINFIMFTWINFCSSITLVMSIQLIQLCCMSSFYANILYVFNFF